MKISSAAPFLTSIILIVLITPALLGQAEGVQFQIPITITSGANADTLFLGVSGDGPNPPGTIIDNTIGVDYDTSFGAYRENLAPPPPPDPFPFDDRFLTIPGRVSTFPTGLGGGTYKDFRGFSSTAQVDSFRIQITGQDPNENIGATISWPGNLNLYGTAWTIKPLSGSAFTQTNMLTSTSVSYTPQFGPVNILIIKTGAFSPPLGPTFVLSTSSLPFGNVAVGDSATLPVTVANTGSTNVLSIINVTPSAYYTVRPNPPASYPITVASGASHNFDLTFIPPSAGTFVGTIVFAHNAPGSPDTVEASGEGRQSIFQVNPLALNFGDVSVGVSRVESLAVTNVGNIPLNVISVSATNPRFTISPDSATIAPQATAPFFVTYTPSDTGLHSGTVVLIHSAPGSPDSVGVAGRGVAAIYSANPTQINFGQVPLGSSRLDSFTVSNQGNIPLTLSSVVTTGQQFTVNPPSGSVGAGGSLTIRVTFAPDSIRPYTAAVVLTHNGATSPDTVWLQGDAITSVNDDDSGLPTQFALHQNYPNPFNPTTNIRFSVPEKSDVRISIYNVLGQEVRTLFADQMNRGTKAVEWDGRDNHGRQLSSGVYIYRMVAGSFTELHKALLLK